MWKHQESTNLLTRLVVFLVLSAQLLETAQALSDKRLCADEHCKKIISLGTGKINYRAGEEGMVSFKINTPIRIKSKSAGSNPSLWGIVVNNREGYAPKNLILEHKIFISEKDLKYEVDVEQKPNTPVLSASEKVVEQESVSETATTMPLNHTPAESSEHILNNISTEQISAENIPVATPVLSETDDGAKQQISDNNHNDSEQNGQDKVQSSSNNADGHAKDIQDIVETEINPQNKTEQEYKNDEISKQQINNYELNISEERQQNGNPEGGAEKEANLEKTYDENSFENETNISKLSDELLTKEATAELETSKDNISLEAPNVLSGSLLEEHTSVKETSLKNSDLPAQDQEANMLDEVQSNEVNAEVETAANPQKETNSLEATNTVSESLVESANQNAAKEEENNTSPKDSKENTENIVPYSNYNNTEANINNSANTSGQELPNNNSVVNLENDFNKTQTESNLASETLETNNLKSESEKEIHQILNEEDLIQQLKIDNGTAGNDANLESVITAGSSSDEEIYLTMKTATGSSENKGEVASDEPLEKDANTFGLQDTTEKVTKYEYYLTETGTDLSGKNIESKANEIEPLEIAPNAALENSKTDDGANNQQHEAELKDNNNSINSHNHQHELKNEVYEDVPLRQTREDTDKPTDNINSFPTESMLYYKEPTNVESAVKTEIVTEPSTGEADALLLNTIYQAAEEVPRESEIVENINPTTTSDPIGDIFLNTPLPTYQEDISASVPPNDNHAQHFEHSQAHADTSAPIAFVNADAPPGEEKHENRKAAPSLDNLERKENKGLFATIMETVNNVLTSNRKKQNELNDNDELDRILFSPGTAQKDNVDGLSGETSFPYCQNIGPNGDCPESSEDHVHSTPQFHPTASQSDLTVNAFLTTMAAKILEMSQMIAFLGIAAAASLFFVFGYYCFCNSSREGALLLKLNQFESSLLASHKENAILKHNLMSTRQKLASIEDNSFGSNDMVVSLKKELEEELLEKAKLQEQITVLQKELENAADAGIELNKIVSELLSNQTGDESIISSVEELQKQLNEQQNTIYEINASLAEKSRENSELQLMIAEQNAKYEAELANVQRDNDELEHEKGNLLTRLEEMKTDFDKDITVALEGKNMEIKRLQNDILDLNNSLEHEHTKWQTSVAKIEALEECLKNVRKDPKVNISEVIDVANVKAQLIEAQKMCKSLKERFETELDSRKLVENQLEIVSAEVEKLKQDFNQSEKDKLEAQTRLEVLSNYFKDKENQLQKELSLKEAMWLKQQGETTTTVDRVTAMQEEIQSLKSQNDSLRAEIEAQLAAHKAQTGTLENRAHETWLAARQSDRRYEEARAEATALRRKLTALAGGSVTESNKPSAGPVALGDELIQAPSPIHMESPGSPMLGRMPPPPPFLPPPFMGPPPPFMGMPPPPPFVPPGEMRPAPLGRIMSPPPQRSGRFSPQHLDYDDYLDYEGNNAWHRYTYSPPPRTYRSLSPTDSRYNYGTERDLMSTYDTETDFSPPPSPRESRRRIGNSSERIDSSNTKISYGNTNKFNSSSRGPLSSGSENSYNAHSHNDTKTKKGNATVGSKNLV